MRPPIHTFVRGCISNLTTSCSLLVSRSIINIQEILSGVYRFIINDTNLKCLIYSRTSFTKWGIIACVYQRVVRFPASTAENTICDLSDILQERYPEQRGFSIHSIKSFCEEKGIRQRGLLSDEQLDNVVKLVVSEVQSTLLRFTVLYCVVFVTIYFFTIQLMAPNQPYCFILFKIRFISYRGVHEANIRRWTSQETQQWK